MPVLYISNLNDFFANQVAPATGTGTGGIYISSDIRRSYATCIALDGSGQKVGLLVRGGFDLSDIHRYEQEAGLPDVPVNAWNGENPGLTRQLRHELRHAVVGRIHGSRCAGVLVAPATAARRTFARPFRIVASNPGLSNDRSCINERPEGRERCETRHSSRAGLARSGGASGKLMGMLPKSVPVLGFVIVGLGLAALELSCGRHPFPVAPDTSRHDAAIVRAAADSATLTDSPVVLDYAGAAADVATLADAPFVLGDAGAIVAQIDLTESTNTRSSTVIVYADASAIRTVGPPKGGGVILPDGAVVPLGPTPMSWEAGSPVILQFLQDLAAAGDVSAIPITSFCFKSTSFGTRTYVSAGGASSGDLQCATNLNPAQEALVHDCIGLTG